MKDQFREQLPQQVLALIDEIEQFAGLEIQVEQTNAPLLSDHPAVNALAATADETRACIKYYAVEDFTPDAVIHELLHIRRAWIEQVPFLTPRQQDAGQQEITSAIENTLEHMIIVPRELDYGFNPFPYWNDSERELWVRYAHLEADPWLKRAEGLMGWLSTQYLTTDPQVQEMARLLLAQENLLADALAFESKIRKMIKHKPSVLSAVIRFLNIPREDVCLVSFDIRNQRRLTKDLPAY